MLRPWPADDGALIRLRLAGGHLPAGSLEILAQVAHDHGDGQVYLTGRANLQLRALPFVGGQLPDEVVDAVVGTGLLPSRSHELARNLMCSPLTGISGGRADLRPVVHELDERLCALPELAALPGRFLFVLDDGRGDLVDRETDLGAVVLDADTAQLRVGAGWGAVVPLPDVAEELVQLAHRFLLERGHDETAAWHVAELESPLAPPAPGDARVPAASGIPSYDGVLHVPVPDGVLTPDLVGDLVGPGHDLVVTPWHGVVVTP
ncbi:nitrite reductase [Nocardioides sp. KIGAM211]|uniref:Nitrite reductase n=1 Tax=Nocardioides luti TaxID=2761101 RepID=A0A7X0VD84_9ACTN|nr:nitrite reductase [Nocardioides luti]